MTTPQKYVPDEPMAHFGIRIPDTLREAIEALAATDNRTASDWARLELVKSVKAAQEKLKDTGEEDARDRLQDNVQSGAGS